MDAPCSLGAAPPSCHASQGQAMKPGQMQHLAQFTQPESVAHNEYLPALQYRPGLIPSGPSGSSGDARGDDSFDHTSYHLPNSPSSRAHHYNRPSPGSHCDTVACPGDAVTGSLEVAKAAKGASICSPRQSACQLVTTTAITATNTIATNPRELPTSPSPNSGSEPLAHLHIQSPPPAASAAAHQPNFGSQALWPQQHTWATNVATTTIPVTAVQTSSPRHAQDLDHRRRSGAAVAAALAEAAASAHPPDDSLAASALLVQSRHHSRQHPFLSQSASGGDFVAACAAAAAANAGSSDPMHTDSADEGTGCSGVAPPGGGSAAAPAETTTATKATATEAPTTVPAGAAGAGALDVDGAVCGDNTGDLFRVNSLAMSDPEVELLDALLKGNSDDEDGNGVDNMDAGDLDDVAGAAGVGGGFLGGEGMRARGASATGAAGAFGAARAVRPTSFGGAIGPFAEASLQPTLSDYSGRASPGELEDDAVLLAGLEAAADQLEADSAGAATESAAAATATTGGGAIAGAPPVPALAGASAAMVNGAMAMAGAAAAPPQLPHAHLQALRHQPHLLNAYSEPLPFSAPLPHHLALHHNAPGSLAPGSTQLAAPAPAHAPAPAPLPGHAAATSAAPLSLAAASPGPKPPAPHPLPPHSIAPQNSSFAPAASPPAPAPSSPCMGAGNVGSSSPPQLQHQSSAHARTPHRLSRTMPTVEEHGLLPPAHSAPVANCGVVRSPPPMPATAAVSSGGACSPMHVDAGPGMEPRVGSCHSFGACGAGAAGGSSSGGGAPCGGGSGSSAGAKAPVAPGSGHHSSGGGAGVRGSTSGADGGATSAGGTGPDLQAHAVAQAGHAPVQYVSPFDVRGKRVRQHDAPAPAPLAPGPAAPLPNSGAPAGTGTAAAAAKGFGRPSSPNSHGHSVGEPMSIGTGAADPSAGGYAHPHHPYAPYHPAYGMYPPPGPYGMPYDPYYPYGYPHAHGHHPGYPDAPPPPYDMAAGGGPRAPMHYPGFMVPRQRLYRRFMSGLRGRDATMPPELTASGSLLPGTGAAAGAVEGAHCPAGGGGSGPSLMSMGSAPVTSAAASAAAAASDAAAALRLSGQGESVARGGGAATVSEAAALAPTETDGMQAARQCHDMFADDDVALPLPRSTVDGIRQELRAVTQELIQRRMGAAAAATAVVAEAASSGANTMAAVEPQPQPLQPTNSLPMLEGTSSVPTRPPSGPVQPGSASCVSAPPGHGGSHSSLLHKRPSTGPDASGNFSPPRIRPAPSAPAANVFAAAFGSAGTAAALPARCQDGGASWSAGGAGASISAVPASLQPRALYTSEPCSVSQPGLGSPPAMRQLFPGTAAPVAPGYGVRPGSASAPLGSRPAVSGSTASVCHSASGAHPIPPPEARSAVQQMQRPQAPQAGMGMSAAHPQQQHMQQGNSTVAPLATGAAGPAYRVGQQGSVAAEVEGEVEGGEEVHGPAVHRNSASNGAMVNGASAGGAAGSAQPSARAAAGPGQVAAPPPGYYPPPGPYDYHGYGGYYPPGTYGSRPGYGVYPPQHYGMPPPGGYRGGMYGMMHPPPPTYGPTAWPEYAMPPPGSGAPRS